VLYGLHYSRPSQEKDDEQEVLYTTALEPYLLSEKMPAGQPLMLQGSKYVIFSYEGPSLGLLDFILMVYGSCLPMLKLTRRKGQDIEHFYPKGDRHSPQKLTEINCDYLIPIRR